LKITFLGTGTSQGIPIIGSSHPVCLSSNPKDKRLRVSILIEWDNFIYVIDCGPDFRQQMLNANPDHLDGILFTHEHSDHTAGLDDIRPFNFKQGDLPIYAHKRVINALKERFAPFEITNTPFLLGNITVMPIDVLHHKLQVFGFRFGDFAYITDMKTIENTEVEKLKDLKVLVINCLRLEQHQSHLNLEEALAFIAEVKPEKAYLTHISHLLGFHDDVQKSLPKNVFLAYDNLQIKI